MYRIALTFIVILLILGINSCMQHDKAETQKTFTIDQKFENVKELAKHRTNELFDVLNQDLTKQEVEALKFLYAYMPLSDLADYNGDFYLKHIRITFKSRNEIEWAKNIPDDVFKHFVLPHRINNENLDTARIVFFNELKDRVKGMSMYDAALEVNHWCHEKVEYRPADGRTSSSLATMKTAYGRCGEESTFAVAAMRSVCIPARQVYTPRWAHSDDNHAWVEVWADGKWYFLGACEPKPVLDLGWFNEPASRAMLIHARVFGEYQGKEEINISTSQYDDINVVERYAKTFKQFIKVVDTENNPVSDVKIEYQLYNYAEFYPIASKISDKNGLSFLTTGLGELLIWTSNNDSYGFQKIVIGKNDTVTIVLSNPKFINTRWELMPPAASDILKVDLTEAQISENKKKLQYEDSIRNNYVSTFITKKGFLNTVNKPNLWNYVKNSRGNYNEIIDFISNNKDSDLTKSLLNVVSHKDLRDTKASILNDHLKNSLKYKDDYSSEIFTKYILNPRVANEMLLAYRGFLSEKLLSVIDNDVNKLTNWIKDSIVINNDAQAYNIALTPTGLYNLRVANSKSRNIFFVAACRSFGIPARLEPGTNTPQYLSDDNWNDVFFDGEPKQYKKFDVSFKVNKKNLKFTPQYYHHFTLARFENNRFNTLELGEYIDIDKIEDFQLRDGTYRLITSNRLSSGKILVDIKFLEITKDTIIGLDFPEIEIKKEILGTIKLDKTLNTYKGGSINLQEIQSKKNVIIAIIDPDKEPSKHVLNDIQKVKNDLDKLDNYFVFIIQKENLSAGFKPEYYPNLPNRSKITVTEENPEILLNIKMNIDINNALPMILIVNPNGEIIYFSEGYKIGIGNDILKIL